MKSVKLEEKMAQIKYMINMRLVNILNMQIFYSEKFYEAVKHSVSTKGKRLRPILLIATHEIFSPVCEYALNVACAIELLHTYSLIHDDLPAMDNDLLRRGLPSCHAKFGEWVAILAGDALNTLAFELLADQSNEPRPETKLEVIRLVASASGISGIVGGQALDMEFEGSSSTIENIIQMEKLKTGALISASVLVGALIGGGSESEQVLLKKFGEKIGLAFQIKDDLLDISSTEEVLGKSSMKDAHSKKATLPLLYGREESEHRVENLLKQALDLIDGLGKPVDFLREVAKYMVTRRK